ncbi:MAG: VOC family protein [Deltaproteobacteria bacterium]|nr:VOC family protein [Deltaproteobacteria bacterium]
MNSMPNLPCPITFHSSVVIAEDLQAMVRFYRDVLKQEVASDFGACVIFKCGLSVWTPKETHPVATHTARFKPGTGRFELCFETDAFDDAHRRVLQHPHGIRLLHETQTEPWGQRTIRFFDPEDNLVELGESIPCFVRRLHREGLSLDDVAQKTSVPLDVVKKMCGA